MAAAVILIGFVAALYMVRFYRLRENLRRERSVLEEIGQNPNSNRILHISFPDKEAEAFLEAVNAYLSLARTQQAAAHNRERELRAQIENISHDLRTPLTALIGYLELLDEDGLSAENREMVEAVRAKAKSLQRLIGNFYDLSRLELNDYHLQPERLDVARFARELTLTYYQQFEEKGLSVYMTDVSEKPLYIVADAGALERIFSNMLQNALRYAHSYLRMKVFQENDTLYILFENDTASLQPEDMKHLFERFYMSERSRTSQGSGLGLTISKLLAEAMGGSVEAQLEQEVLRITYCFAAEKESFWGDTKKGIR